MRCDASHRLDQERAERHVPRTMPFTEERLADGLLVERARAEIGADELPLLDQPKLLQFASGQGMKPLHHLPGVRCLFSGSLTPPAPRALASFVALTLPRARLRHGFGQKNPSTIAKKSAAAAASPIALSRGRASATSLTSLRIIASPKVRKPSRPNSSSGHFFSNSRLDPFGDALLRQNFDPFLPNHLSAHERR